MTSLGSPGFPHRVRCLLGSCDLGPPQFYVFAVLLTCLAERNSATRVDAANLTSLGTFTILKQFNQEFKQLIPALALGQALAIMSRWLEVASAEWYWKQVRPLAGNLGEAV